VRLGLHQSTSPTVTGLADFGAMTAEEARQEFLKRVQEHPQTDERHYAAAEVLAHSETVPDEHVEAADELAQLGLVQKRPDGSYFAGEVWRI
jgi:hypothetical protein